MMLTKGAYLELQIRRVIGILWDNLGKVFLNVQHSSR